MMLKFHDDDCGELLDADGKCGKCGKCGFHPDMQSTAFRDVQASELRPLLAGRSVFVDLSS
jgi:hypothetical protein